MRLIDADALLEILRKDATEKLRLFDPKYEGYLTAMAKVEEIVEDILPTIDPVKWTPVSERLPEKNGRYLVTCEQWGAWEVDWNIWYMTPRPGWLWEKGITAWMPLPEPWKEKKDETD